MTGIFTGAGVGPGDPELMTVKAIRAVENTDVIALPVSDQRLTEPVFYQNETGQGKQVQGRGAHRTAAGFENQSGGGSRAYLSGCTAYQTARRACAAAEEKDILFLPMPMIKEKERLKAIHDRDVQAVTGLLDQGKNVVFLTLGDPTVYSTCMYVHKRLKGMGYETALIPGVTSFCAAAARLDCSLAENRQELHILPASYEIADSLGLPGTKVLMKAGRKLSQVKELIIEQGLDAKMVENCGMEGERVFPCPDEIPEQAGYYSLLIVKEKSGKKGGKNRREKA